MVEQFYQSDRVLLPQTWDIVYNKSNKSDDLHLEIVHQKTGQTLARRTGAMIVSVEILAHPLRPAKVRSKCKGQ